MRQIEGKLEDLLRAGWADREDFLKVQDKSDELRATIAAAAEHFAPIARIEQQVAALSDRLEEVAIARAKPAAPKRRVWRPDWRKARCIGVASRRGWTISPRGSGTREAKRRA